MPTPPARRPNAGMPWTPEETEELRRLAEAGVAPGEIADRLGRSPASVWNRSWKAGISLGKNGAARSVEREEARRRGAGGTEAG